MIEAKGVRIFIDPLYVSNYTDLHADAILITHLHMDHYSPEDINALISDDTLFVCPNNMTDAIDRYDGFGVDPGDSFLVGDINITAFPMYMPEYPKTPGYSFHPKSANWTSYILDIDGFTIYHAGDGKNMTELVELTGTIDLAFLSIYYDEEYGPINESFFQTINAIDMLQPRTVIPMHFHEMFREIFITEYRVLAESPDCEILDIQYYTTCTFVIDGTET